MILESLLECLLECLLESMLNLYCFGVIKVANQPLNVIKPAYEHIRPDYEYIKSASGWVRIYTQPSGIQTDYEYIKMPASGGKAVVINAYTQVFFACLECRLHGPLRFTSPTSGSNRLVWGFSYDVLINTYSSLACICFMLAFCYLLFVSCLRLLVVFCFSLRSVIFCWDFSFVVVCNWDLYS